MARKKEEIEEIVPPVEESNFMREREREWRDQDRFSDGTNANPLQKWSAFRNRVYQNGTWRTRCQRLSFRSHLTLPFHLPSNHGWVGSVCLLKTKCQMEKFLPTAGRQMSNECQSSKSSNLKNIGLFDILYFFIRHLEFEIILNFGFWHLTFSESVWLP